LHRIASKLFGSVRPSPKKNETKSYIIAHKKKVNIKTLGARTMSKSDSSSYPTQSDTAATNSKPAENSNLNVDQSVSSLLSTNSASTSEFGSSSGKYRHAPDDDPDSMLKPNLTVEEIFAHGLEEWKRARDEVKRRRLAAGKVPPKGIPRPGGSLHDPKYDADFDKEVVELLEPNRHKLFNIVRKSSAEQISAEGKGKGKEEASSSLPNFEEVLRKQLHQLQHQEVREKRSASISETREVTEDDRDAIHKQKVAKWSGYVMDALRVVIVLIIAFLLTGLPWFLEEESIEPEVFNFNLTEGNICFWVGSTSILDELNPCPYRGYVSMDRDANNCWKWSEVMANEDWVRSLKATNELQAGVLPRDYLKWVEELKPRFGGQDFNAPFCRRLAKGNTDGVENFPKCFVKMDNEGNELEVPRISNCWVVGCTLKVSNDCYKKYWMAKRNEGAQNAGGEK